MPKTVKKSKPKQRTNWKQRAEFADERCVGYSARLAEIHRELHKAKNRAAHCESVIEINSVLAARREKELKASENYATQLESNIKFLQSRLDGEFNRAELAEKHNALLLEKCQTPGTCVQWADLPVDGQRKMLFALLEKTEASAPTHWQRFKSWLANWYLELLGLMVVLSALAGYVAFVWKQGG